MLCLRAVNINEALVVSQIALCVTKVYWLV